MEVRYSCICGLFCVLAYKAVGGISNMEQSWVSSAFSKTLRRSAYARFKGSQSSEKWSRGPGMLKLVVPDQWSRASYFKYEVGLD